MPQLQETFHVWACILAQILQNFLRSPLALPGSAFHKALELDRAMFAREVNGSLAHALVAAEVGVLPDAPARVTAQKIRVAGGVAQRSPAGIVGADAREDTLQLLQAVVSVGPGAILVPVRHVELQEELGDRAVAKLFDGNLLEGIKSGPPVIDAA